MAVGRRAALRWWWINTRVAKWWRRRALRREWVGRVVGIQGEIRTITDIDADATVITVDRAFSCSDHGLPFEIVEGVAGAYIPGDCTRGGLNALGLLGLALSALIAAPGCDRLRSPTDPRVLDPCYSAVVHADSVTLEVDSVQWHWVPGQCERPPAPPDPMIHPA